MVLLFFVHDQKELINATNKQQAIVIRAIIDDDQSSWSWCVVDLVFPRNDQGGGETRMSECVCVCLKLKAAQYD